MEIPFISSFVLLQPNTTHRCTMFSSFAKETLRHREIRENGSPVLTSQTTIPRLSPYAVLYRTGSEISRICRPQKRGRKIDREFIFSIFIREKHEDSIKEIKKICHIHFKYINMSKNISILGFHVTSRAFPNLDVGHVGVPSDREIYDNHNSKPDLTTLAFSSKFCGRNMELSDEKAIRTQIGPMRVSLFFPSTPKASRAK